MSDPYNSAWAKIAAEIAAEKRQPAEAETAQAAIVNRLVAEVVKARLHLAGITDETQIGVVMKRVTVSESGDLVGLDEHGRPGIGSGPNYTMSLDDVVQDIGAAKPADSSSHGKGRSDEPNPFAKSSFNITRQMLIRREDPAKADHLEYLASIGRA